MIADTFKSFLAPAFSWAVIALLVSFVVAVLYPRVRDLLLVTTPNVRTRITLVYALMPFVIAAVTQVIYANPAVSNLIIHPHCHNSVCGPHDLYLPISHVASVAFIYLGGLGGLLLCLFFARRLIISKRYLRQLQAFSSQSAAANFRVLETPRLMAWCAGFWSPQIYLSRGLLEGLTAKQRAVVLAHECAHAARNDNIRMTLLSWATIFWKANLRRQIRQDYRNDTEICCDIEAMKRTGDVELEEVMDALCRCSAGNDSNTDNASLAQRLDALATALAKPHPTGVTQWARSLAAIFAVILFWLLLALASLHFGHPFIEWLLK